MSPLAYAVIGLLALAVLYIGWTVSRAQRAQGADPRLAATLAEHTRLVAELERMNERARGDAAELGSLRADAEAHARLRAEHAQLRAAQDALRSALEAERVARSAAVAELADRNAQLDAARGKAQALDAQLVTLQGEHAEARAHLEHARRQHEEMRSFVDQAQEKLADAFAQMAGRVFAERGEQFEKNVRRATVQSKTDIETLLKPFAEQLGQFRQRVDTVYGDEARDRATLTGAVEKLHRLNETMAERADQLTRALRGNAKVRGDWGELMLENVLRASGLEAGKHYERQQSGSDDEGRVLRPDIVVRLPDERLIVIDSKVNLIAWQDAMNAEAPEAQHDAMRRHAVALRQHVKDLAERNYPKAIGDNALDTTVLFVPIEGALSAALGADDALQAFAFEKRIVFASPNTLMAVLRVVDRLWTRDKLQKQAQKIGEAGGLLLDALTAFLTDFDRVGAGLQKASDTFRDARNRLSESPQAVMGRARRLVELGARGKKTLHVDLQPDDALLLEAADDTPRSDA